MGASFSLHGWGTGEKKRGRGGAPETGGYFLRGELRGRRNRDFIGSEAGIIYFSMAMDREAVRNYKKTRLILKSSQGLGRKGGQN